MRARTFVVVLSFIPLLQPVPDADAHDRGPRQPRSRCIVAIALLAIVLPLALWLAARFYAAGVLMYGQRPGLRMMLRVLRGAR